MILVILNACKFCREALKEQELAEKKLARLEAARSTDINSLQSEVEALKTNARADVKAKDLEINRLVENLGNSEAMLNDKTQELEQVGKIWLTDTSEL